MRTASTRRVRASGRVGVDEPHVDAAVVEALAPGRARSRPGGSGRCRRTASTACAAARRPRRAPAAAPAQRSAAIASAIAGHLPMAPSRFSRSRDQLGVDAERERVEEVAAVAVGGGAADGDVAPPSPACDGRRRASSSPVTPSSPAKWSSVPPGTTASGSPASRAMPAAVLTVPSPPADPEDGRGRAASRRACSMSSPVDQHTSASGSSRAQLGLAAARRCSPAPARRVDDEDEPGAVGQRRRLGDGGGLTAGRAGRAGQTRRDGQRRPRAERESGDDVTGVVHAGVDPAVGHAGCEQADGSAEQRLLHRHADGEGRGGRRVPAREGRGRRLPRAAAATSGTGCSSGRARRADQLGGDVGRRAGDRQAEQTPRTAARRRRPPDAASSPATPIHSRPWSAARVSRGQDRVEDGARARAARR